MSTTTCIKMRELTPLLLSLEMEHEDWRAFSFGDNMREELKKINEVRSTFTATFERTGTKSSFGHPKPTLLFKDVRDHTGKIVAEHLWFNYTKGFMELGLEAGDVVQFDARVKAYEKGYKGWRDDVWDSPIETDYKLSHPTRLVKL